MYVDRLACDYTKQALYYGLSSVAGIIKAVSKADMDQTHTCDVDEGRLRGSVAAVGSAVRAAAGAITAREGEHAGRRRRAGTAGWARRLSAWRQQHKCIRTAAQLMTLDFSCCIRACESTHLRTYI